MKFGPDSSRVGGEREVCTNRCVIVGYLWAICGQRGRREEEGEGEGEGKGEGKAEGKAEGGGRGGGGGEGTVGIRGRFMFSFLRLGKLQSLFCDFWEKIEIKMCVCVWVCFVWVCGDRKELELRGVCPRHLCVRPPRYTCTSIRAVIIDTWPANYWF